MFHQHIDDYGPDNCMRLVEATAIVKRMYQNNIFKGSGYNCHILVRVIKQFVKGTVRSGYINHPYYDENGDIEVEYTEHSWLQVQRGWLIDVKPVGMVAFSPILVDTGKFGAGHAWYNLATHKNYPKAARTPEIRKKVNELTMRLLRIFQDDPLRIPEIDKYFTGHDWPV